MSYNVNIKGRPADSSDISTLVFYKLMDWMKPTLDEDEDEDEDEEDERERERKGERKDERKDERKGERKGERQDERKGRDKGRDKDKQEEMQSTIATLAKKTFEETLRQMNVAMTGLLLLKPDHKERVIELSKKHHLSTPEPQMIVSVSFEEEAIAAVKLTDWIIHRAISMIDESNVSLRKHTFDPVEMLSGTKIPFFEFLSHNSTMIEAKCSESTRTHSLPIFRARDTYRRKVVLGENELYQFVYEMYVTLVREGERVRRAVLTDGTHWVFLIVRRDTDSENNQGGSYIYGSRSIPTKNTEEWETTEYVLDNGDADCIAGIVAYWVLHSHDGDIAEDDWFELLDFNSKPSEPSA